MPWFLIDLLIALAALAALIVAGLAAFGRVKALKQTISKASTRVGEAMPPPVEPSKAPHHVG